MGRFAFGRDARRGGYAVRRANVAIAVAEDARDRILEVAAVCRALGLEHTSTLTDIGVLLGSVELGNLLTLRAVPGVVAVEIEREFRMKQVLWGG
jgi:hypothetical protein